MGVRLTKGSLAKVGIDLDFALEGNAIIQCQRCGWGGELLQLGKYRRRPKGWWKCPNGCNEPKE